MMMILKWILLLFIMFRSSISNYNLYSIIDKSTGIKYDCLYTYLDPYFFDTLIRDGLEIYQQLKEQINSFCLMTEYLIVNEEICMTNNGTIWTFEQLKRLNTTSDQLLNWNAMVDIIDDYEYYLFL